MNSVAFIFLASAAIVSGCSSDTSGSDRRPHCGIDHGLDERDTCQTEASISVKAFRNSRGEWLTTFVAGKKLGNLSRIVDIDLRNNVVECGDAKYITVRGFLKGEDSGNSSEASTGDPWNEVGDKEDSCKRSFDIPTRSDTVFINKTLGESLIMAGNSSDGIVAIESRLNNVENTLKSVEETLNKMRNAMEMNMPRCGHFDERAKGKKIQLYNHLKTAERTSPLQDGGVYGGVISNDPLLHDKVFTFRIDETIDKLTEYGLSLGVITRKSESVEKATYIHYVPLQDGGVYGGVISNDPLLHDKVFTFRIDETIDKLTEYGLSLGVITRKSESVEKATYIHYVSDDNWGIYGRPIFTGKSTVHTPERNSHVDAYPMDTRNLSVGTRLGIMRRSNGDLHFFLNGVDKGVAIGGVTEGVYAFVDVANYVTKISVVC